MVYSESCDKPSIADLMRATAAADPMMPLVVESAYNCLSSLLSIIAKLENNSFDDVVKIQDRLIKDFTNQELDDNGVSGSAVFITALATLLNASLIRYTHECYRKELKKKLQN